MRYPIPIALSLIISSATNVAFATDPALAPHVEGKVYIISPKDGETVSNPVSVIFGLSGMGIAPAGIDKPNTGHHHLLVDGANLPAMDQPIPQDDHHRHFGKGQTETLLTLEPGKHTLQLMLGNKDHIPVGSSMVSEKITIEVK